MSITGKFGDKHCEKLINTTTKTGIKAAKYASKRVAQKTAEATGYLTGNKVADKITSLGKTKSKEKEDKTNKKKEIYIPPETRQHIIDDLRFMWLKWCIYCC